MVQKLSELRVRAAMDAGQYKAGMDQKVAADQAGAASSQRLSTSVTSSQQKISVAGSVVERLSRQYVDGYAATQRFETAIRQLGRGVETGNVPLGQAGTILDGINKKFGMTASAAQLAESGYTKLAATVEKANAVMAGQTNSAGAIDQRLNVKDDFGTVARAADIAAFGEELDRLEAKYNPLLSAQKQYAASIEEINRALKVGAIDEAAHTAALARAEAAYRQVRSGASQGVVASTDEASDGLRKLGQAAAALDGPLGGVASRFRSLGELIRQTNVSTVVMTLGLSGAVLAVKRFAVGFADTWSDLNARVGLAIGNMDNSAAALNRIATIARRTYSALDQTAESYIQNSTVLKELGKTTTQQLDYTEALNLAMVVSGAKGDRAAQVQESLARAMALGSLRGVELNTVIRTGGRVSEVLAEELGVTTNQLRRVGEQGKITASVIYNALTKRMETLRAEAEKMPATIGDALMIMRNSLMQTIGVFDQNNKLSESLATAIIGIADSMSVLVKAAVGVAAIFAGRLVAAYAGAAAAAIQYRFAVATGNAVVIGSATANEMRARSALEAAMADRTGAVSATAATAAQNAHVAALARTTLAARVSTIAMRGLQSVFAFFGGPVGLAFTAISVGLAVWATRATLATRAMESHRSIVEQIREAYERAGAASGNWADKIAKGTWLDATRNLQDFKTELQTVRNSVGKIPTFMARGDSSQLANINQVNDLIAKFRDGALSASDFRTAIDDLSRTDRSLAIGLGPALLAIAKNAAEVESKVQGAEAAIRAINGVMTDGDKKTLGLEPPPTAHLSEDDNAKKMREAFEQRLLQAQQRIELARLELSLEGQSVAVQEQARAAAEIRQSLEEEALRIYGNKEQYDRKHYLALVAEADQLNTINQRLKQAETLRGLRFEREQLGRSDIDQTVYSRMQSLGLLTDGKIVGAQNEMIAAEIRFNEQLSRSIEIQKEFASSFLHDMMAGKSATEALGNALSNLASKMLDNSLNMLFAGLSGGGFIKGGGGLFGGNILPGILHSGGIAGNDNYPRRSVPLAAFAGAPRYHNGGIAGASPFRPGEMPAILQKGEIVLPKGQAAGSGQGGSQRLDVRVSLDSDMLRAVVVDESGRQVAASQKRMAAALPSTIVDVVRQARNDRKI
ncbi:tape measure protein [Hyphomicrobium sp. ghe19]|uniref:tape measure protein n=1 Tax=Hyphomicrobium sp. ghe19 TaxID=2682968 RepID=UPI0013674FBC|nr:hypothetical protein HYPP_03765 [Hyphomicrobium sp. ghe19]